MPNRLAAELSPYLLQHAHNPVDWYAWGDESLAAARTLDRPILLSIGYAACHWCHVMERESFEDESTARLMNDNFVCIKVDREERPDLDQIYQQALQLLGGHGGWPLTLFLTPDGRPFYGGTYFPPVGKYGMPAFKEVLTGVTEAFRARRKAVDDQAAQLTESLQQLSRGETRFRAAAEARLLDEAEAQLLRRADFTHGGFGERPKFPNPTNLAFLLGRARAGSAVALSHVELSCTKMAAGGMYDQLGGGFHRYSTDERWLIPHFEKMLYDNALLVPIYAALHRSTGNLLAREVVRGTLGYLEREMTSPEGGFFATQDADSESVEGKFFAWTPESIRAVMGDADGELVCRVYGVTPSGNFEHGTSVLHVTAPTPTLPREGGGERSASWTPEEETRLALARAKLFAARETRIHPARDEKILTAWNGLALSAFCAGARALGGEDGARWTAVAQRAATFILAKLAPNDQVFRVYKDGVAKLSGTLDDHAFFAAGLFDLFLTDFDPRWLNAACRLTDRALARFTDPDGGFFLEDGSEPLVARPRSGYDNAIPSGAAVLVRTLLRLHALTGEARYERAAQATLELYAGAMARSAFGFGEMLRALSLWLEGPRVVVVAAARDDAAARALVDAGWRDPETLVVLAIQDRPSSPHLPALLEGKSVLDGAATAYVCRRGTCSPPVTDPASPVLLFSARSS